MKSQEGILKFCVIFTVSVMNHSARTGIFCFFTKPDVFFRIFFRKAFFRTLFLFKMC